MAASASGDLAELLSGTFVAARCTSPHRPRSPGLEGDSPAWGSPSQGHQSWEERQQQQQQDWELLTLRRAGGLEATLAGTGTRNAPVESDAVPGNPCLGEATLAGQTLRRCLAESGPSQDVESQALELRTLKRPVQREAPELEPEEGSSGGSSALFGTTRPLDATLHSGRSAAGLGSTALEAVGALEEALACALPTAGTFTEGGATASSVRPCGSLPSVCEGPALLSPTVGTPSGLDRDPRQASTSSRARPASSGGSGTGSGYPSPIASQAGQAAASPVNLPVSDTVCFEVGGQLCDAYGRVLPPAPARVAEGRGDTNSRIPVPTRSSAGTPAMSGVGVTPASSKAADRHIPPPGRTATPSSSSRAPSPRREAPLQSQPSLLSASPLNTDNCSALDSHDPDSPLAQRCDQWLRSGSGGTTPASSAGILPAEVQEQPPSLPQEQPPTVTPTYAGARRKGGVEVVVETPWSVRDPKERPSGNRAASAPRPRRQEAAAKRPPRRPSVEQQSQGDAMPRESPAGGQQPVRPPPSAAGQAPARRSSVRSASVGSSGQAGLAGVQSNRKNIRNAIEKYLLKGEANRAQRDHVLQALDDEPSYERLVILFKSIHTGRHDLRAVYAYSDGLWIRILEILGSPPQLQDNMVVQCLRYDSGGKTFKEVPALRERLGVADAVFVHHQHLPRPKISTS